MGFGKTYFVKNNLFSEILKENFRPIYISLNGISDINQLEQTILLELLKLPGNSNLAKPIFSSLSGVIGKFSSMLTKGYINLDITKLNLVSLFPLDNSILFFDDLERISSKICIDEILGYINTHFVEHKKVKTVLVGDITKLSNTDKFETIKEKLVGREFLFSYSSQEIWELILNKYSDKNDFLQFLKRIVIISSTLIDGFSVYNLRTIFFFIDVLFKVFPFLPAKKVLHEQVILFSFLITLEFKLGSFHKDEFQKRKVLIDMANNAVYYNLIAEKNIEGEHTSRSYGEIFASMYLKELRHSYKYFHSIYNLIVFGELKVDLAKRDFTPNLQDIYIFALHKLNDFYILSRKEIDENYKIIIDGLDKGIFNIYTHQYVFDTLYSLAIKNIIDISISNLKLKIFDSLEIAKKRNEFDQYSFDTFDFHSLTNEDSKEVFNKIKNLHTSFFKNQKDSQIKSILDELTKDKADFSNLIHSFVHVNFSDYFTSKEIVDKINSSPSTYNITKFARFIAEKYRYDNYTIVADKKLIEDLVAAVKKGINSDTNSTLLKTILENFQRILEKIISEFNIRIPKPNNNN